MDRRRGFGYIRFTSCTCAHRGMTSMQLAGSSMLWWFVVRGLANHNVAGEILKRFVIPGGA